MDRPETSETSSQVAATKDSGVEITWFSEVLDEATVHFQILRFDKQIYVWIGCNSAKMGSLYAAAPTRPHNEVSVASILAGTSDSTGSGIARRLVLRTGLNIVLACNLPKNNSMLEVCSLFSVSKDKISAFTKYQAHKTMLEVCFLFSISKDILALQISAEKKLAEKLISLGYSKPRSANQREQ